MHVVTGTPVHWACTSCVISLCFRICVVEGISTCSSSYFEQRLIFLIQRPRECCNCCWASRAFTKDIPQSIRFSRILSGIEWAGNDIDAVLWLRPPPPSEIGSSSTINNKNTCTVKNREKPWTAVKSVKIWLIYREITVKYREILPPLFHPLVAWFDSVTEVISMHFSWALAQFGRAPEDILWTHLAFF